MRYESTESEARFLIEHMLDEPESVSTPTSFLSRACWNDLFLDSIAESPEGVDSHNNNGTEDNNDKSDDNDEEEKEERAHCHQGGLLSTNKLSGETNYTDGKRCAAFDEEEAKLSSSLSLDFMDKEEELEAVLHMAMTTSFHRMFGPPQAQAGNFPPSQI